MAEDQKEDKAEVSASWSGIRAVFQFFRPYKPKFLWAAAALACAGILQLFFAYLSGNLVDGTLAHREEGADSSGWLARIDSVGIAMISTLAGIVAFTYTEMRIFGSIGERAIGDLRVRAFSNVVRAPMGDLLEKRGGEVSGWLLADLAVVQEFVIHDIRLALKYVIVFVGSLSMMVVTSPRLAVILLAILPVVAIFGWFFGKKIRSVSAGAQAGLADSSVVADEALQGIRSVKAAVKEDYESDRYQAAVGRFLDLAVRGVRYRSLLVCSVIFVLLSSAVFFMWFGSREIQAGALTPGEFTRFMFFMAFAGSSGGTMAVLYGKLQRVLGSADRVRSALEVEGEDLGAQKDDATANVKGHIQFKDVGFAYPGRSELTVLDGVTFEIEPGKMVALVGPSGAGKSTIVSILLRFFEPKGGQVTLDGKPLEDYPLGLLRSQFALVPQEVILHGGTLWENIAYGSPDISRDRVVAAAKMAHADEFISEFPEGYETKVGDRGAQLSGGQRQRIALARAFLEDPAVLLLDEATSALDGESERLIQDALDQFLQDRTALVIAHRLSTVRRADLILVMKEGKIIESGTHDELFSAGGYYRDLCDRDLG